MEEKRSPMITDNLEGFEIEGVDYGRYETSFRRWLVQEIESGRMSLLEARERFKLPYHFHALYKQWQKKYSDQICLTLPLMTEKERLDFKAKEDRIRQLECQLDQEQLRVKALNIMIDIVEKDYKIEVRKKAGPRQ